MLKRKLDHNRQSTVDTIRKLKAEITTIDLIEPCSHIVQANTFSIY